MFLIAVIIDAKLAILIQCYHYSILHQTGTVQMYFMTFNFFIKFNLNTESVVESSKRTCTLAPAILKRGGKANGAIQLAIFCLQQCMIFVLHCCA